MDSFLKFAKAHPWNTTLNILFSMTFPIDDIFIPIVFGIIVSRIQENKDWIRPMIILIITLSVMQVMYNLAYWHDAYFIPKMQSYLKHEMVDSFMKQYEGVPTTFNTGEVMSRIVKIPIVFTEFYSLMKNYIVPYILSFSITSIIVFRLNRIMGIVLFIAALVIFSMYYFTPKVCWKLASMQEKAHAQVDEQIDDILNNLQIVYACNTGKAELKRLDTYEMNYQQLYAKSVICMLKGRVVCTIALISILVALGIIAYKGINNKTIAVGTFITILTVISQWVSVLSYLSNIIKDITLELSIINSFSLSIPLLKPKKTTINNVTEYNQNYIIRIVNLTYSSPVPYKTVLQNFTLTVYENERICLVGDVGCGKSTLLKLLSGLYIPNDGYIFIDGKLLSVMSKQDIHRIIGYVPQNPFLFNRSILENIKYGTEDISNEQVFSLVQSLGLTESLGDLDKSVGKGGMLLSGGQRQLVAILRTILANPKILLMDEITSSLDKKTKEKLFEVLLFMFKGKTVIMATHDPDMLVLGTRVVRMD